MSKTKVTRSTKRSAAPKAPPRFDLKLATNYDPDSAHPFGLLPHSQVCPGCEQRLATRPKSRVKIASMIVGGLRVQQDRHDAVAWLLGICTQCTDRLFEGLPVHALGLSVCPTMNYSNTEAQS